MSAAVRVFTAYSESASPELKRIIHFLEALVVFFSNVGIETEAQVTGL
jgi:hypothetical protein